MVFFFFFFLSSLITPHSIFVTYHSSLKIPQFPQLHLFGTHHSVLLLLFVSKKKKTEKSKICGWALFQQKKKKENPKSQTLRLNSERVVSLITKMPLETELWKLKGLFGSSISITHISVSITHNSKIVGPIARSPFDTTITLFPSLNYLILKHHSIIWFLSYELWKLKTHFSCFQFP